MGNSTSPSPRWLIGAIAATAAGIVAAVLVLALHHQSPTVTTTAGAGTPTTTTTTTTPSAGSAATTATSPTIGTPPAPAPTAAPRPPHFDTPQAAMAYLTVAWNANNTIALDHVTNPAARAELATMHGEAVNLRLNHCSRRPQGDYICYFDHDYPAGTPTTLPGGVGHAVFLAGPADTPGWYMTVFITCG